MLTEQATETVTIRTFSNQKPWVDRSIRDAVNHRTAAYNTGLLSGVMITYNIYIVIKETGQFSSKGIINDFIGNLNRLTVSRRFTEQAV